MLQLLAEFLIALLILAGSFFLLVGSLGLARLPTLVQRLHAPTKAATLGAGGLLLASSLYFWLQRGHPSYHEALIVCFCSCPPRSPPTCWPRSTCCATGARPMSSRRPDAPLAGPF